jgi:2,4-dienoyl-CoA reductase-like NADH-dependent reductase (Old Yellow Enzyme family)
MSPPNLDVLFRPFKLNGLELRNRVVMAPMTRSFSPQGIPGENVAAYYRRRAEGEVGLILSEGTTIERPAAKNEPDVPDFYGESALAGWQHVIKEVHDAGGKMGPQLWHVGSAQNPTMNWKAPGPVDSPSGLSSPGKRFSEPMSDEAIADTLTAYGRAAADAKQLGFDVVEIHGAHGYLLDQFFWAGTNERCDRFGGATVRERSRFAAEVVRTVRGAVGAEFPITLRLSQWKQQDFAARIAETPELMADWLEPLVDAGVDALHCSQRRFWEPEFPELDGAGGLNFAGWAKKLTGITTISVGSVGLSGDLFAALQGERSTPASLDHLLQRLERGEFDLIAVGRALISDPNWVKKIKTGEREGLKDFTAEGLGELI